jgi:hypothetical protein
MKLGYFLLYVIAASLIAYTSFLTVSASSPTIYSPYSFAVVFPAMMLPFGEVSCFFISIIYLMWSFPLAKGQKKIPIRSIILSVVLILLSAAYFYSGMKYGFEYQEEAYVKGVCTLNGIFWALLLVIYIINKRRPLFVTNLLFHATLFVWLSWVAFPWLGEVL